MNSHLCLHLSIGLFHAEFSMNSVRISHLQLRATTTLPTPSSLVTAFNISG